MRLTIWQAVGQEQPQSSMQRWRAAARSVSVMVRTSFFYKTESPWGRHFPYGGRLTAKGLNSVILCPCTQFVKIFQTDLEISTQYMEPGIPYSSKVASPTVIDSPDSETVGSVLSNHAVKVSSSAVSYGMIETA